MANTPQRKTAPKASDDFTISQLRGPLNNLIVDRMRRLDIHSLKEFGDHSGISRTVLHDLIRGRSTATGAWVKPSLETMVKLATALDTPLHEIVYLFEPDAHGARELAHNLNLPVYIAGHVGAGPQQLEASGETVCVPAAWARGRDLIAFCVRGDSMAGGNRPIFDGDRVVVDRKASQQINSPVVARLRDDGYVCKRLRVGDLLDSTNPTYDDPDMSIITPNRVAQIIGPVVRIVSNVT